MKKCFSSPFTLTLAVALGLAAFAAPAEAAIFTWTGAGNTSAPLSGTWDTTTANMWNDGNGTAGDVLWPSATTAGNAIFGGADGTYEVAVASALNATNLWFQNDGYTLSAASARTISIYGNNGSVVSQVRVDAGKTVTIGQNVLVQNGLSTGLFLGASGSALGGTINLSGTIKQNSSNSGGVDGNGTVLNINTGGTYSGPNNSGSAGSISIGVNGGSSCTVNLLGGALSYGSGTQPLNVGNSGSGTLNVSSGTVTLNGGSVNGIQLSTGNGNGTINLNGGTITAPLIKKGTGAGTATLNFNGGTLVINKNNPTNFLNIDRINVRNGGAIIDSSTFSITNLQPLVHSNIGGDNSVDGGLTKLGTGSLTLVTTNTYTGSTVISNGTLALRGSGCLTASASLLVTNNATLNVSGLSGTFSFPGTVSVAQGTFNLGATHATSSSLSLSDATLVCSVNTSSSTNIVTGVLATGGGANTLTITSIASAGTFPIQTTLIKYSSLAPGVVDGNNKLTTLVANPAPSGFMGYLTNNTAKSSIDLVLTGALTPEPVIQPVSISRYTNSPAQFTVVANNTLGYHWRKNGVYLSDAGNLFGSATAVLTLTNISAADGGAYDVVLTNLAGSVTSSVAPLIIITPTCSYEALVVSNRPVAFYRFNENSPTTEIPNLPAYDFAGGLDGIYGMAAINQNEPGPQPGTGFPGFENSNGAVIFGHGWADSQVTVSSWPMTTNAVTFTAWVYPRGTEDSNDGLIFNRGANVAGLNYSGALDADGNHTLGYTWNNEANTYNWNSGLTPPINQWSLVALVVTPTNATIYVGTRDGLSASVHSYAHVPQAFSGVIALGNDTFSATGGRVFDGDMDEVALFNRALTQNQIAALLSSAVGVSAFPPVIQSQPASLTAYPQDNPQFSVQVSGTAPFGYQWMTVNNGVYQNLVDGQRISGSQSATLTISNLVLTDPTSYVVVVTNVSGAVTSSVAVLTIGTDRPIVTLTADDASGTTSFNTAGHWSNGAAPNSGNDYLVTGYLLRSSPNNDVGNYTFAGHSLTLDGPGVTEAIGGRILTKQGGNNALLTFGSLTLMDLGMIHNAANQQSGGGTNIALAGNLTITNGGGVLLPANGAITLFSTVAGNAPLWLGSPSIASSSNVVFAGSISGFSGPIYSTNNASTLVFSNALDQIYAGKLAMQNPYGLNPILKQGAGKLTLAGQNTYSGSTTIAGGTLALTGSASLMYTPLIAINANATLDVSALSSPFSLGAGQSLAGTGAAGNLNGNINLNSGALQLTYTNGSPVLTVANGTLTLNNNAVTVTVLGTALPSGSFKLVAKSTGGNVTGLVAGAAVTVNGAGTLLGAPAVLNVIGGELYLVVQGQAVTTLALTCSHNPSVVGQPLTFTATLGGSTGTPTGTVRFSEGAVDLGTSNLSGGVAVWSTSSLALGSHAITAVYSGDAANAASTSAAVTELVSQLPQLGSLVRTPSQLVFSFQSQAGQTYQAVYKITLNDQNWIPLNSPFAGTGSLQSVTNSVTGGSCFLRVQVLP